MKNIFLLFLILSSSPIFSQKAEENLRNDFTTYINLTINQEFEKSMDYIVEDFFTIFPKDKMIEVMKQAFNNPSMEIKIENPTILKVDEIEKINQKYYTFLSYSNVMKIKLKPNDNNQSDDNSELSNTTMKTGFEKKFGKKNVKFNEETGFFEIYVEKKVVSVSANGVDNWKFVTAEERQKKILEKFLPAKIINKI